MVMNNPDEKLLEFLKNNRIDSFKDQLNTQGVECFDDLAYVGFEILVSDIGMSMVQANRMIRKRDECLSNLVAYNNLDKTLLGFIEENRLGMFKDKLKKEGIEYFEDLVDVNFYILKLEIGMTPVQANRVIRKRDECLSNLVTKYNPYKTLYELLEENRLDRFEDKLKIEGVEFFDDLVDVTFDILITVIEMNVMQANRMIRKRDECLSNLVDIEYYLYTKLECEKGRLRLFTQDSIPYCDLVNIICNEERNELGEDMTVELYTCEGYPLATRPISYISKLSDWCLEEYPDTPLLYAVPRLKCYTDKCTQYMTAARLCDGTDHIFIRNTECDFKRTIQTNCSEATYFQLVKTIQDMTGIPSHLIQLYQADKHVHSNEASLTLNKLNIGNQSVLTMELNDHFWTLGKDKNFSLQECKPTWHQEQSSFGTSFFFSCLYSLADWMAEPEQKSSGVFYQTLGHIRSITGCPPLIHALNLMFRNSTVTLPHSVAIQECLVLLFKTLIKHIKLDLRISTNTVTENTNYFWAYLIENSNPEHMKTERYNTLNLTCSETFKRMTDPVLVNDVNGVEHIVDRRALNTEIAFDENSVLNLLNYRRMIKSFIGDQAIVWNPTTNIIEVREMECTDLPKKCKNYPVLCVQAPLNVTFSHCLIPSMIPTSDGNVGVYLGNSNDSKKRHVYYDVQTGRSVLFNAQVLDINVRNYCSRFQNLAKLTNEDQVSAINPEEIIMVILDTSNSMGSPYLNGKRKFNSVAEAYKAFLDRTTACDLKHIIGLTLFAKECWLHHELSENFQNFTNLSSILSRGKHTAIYRAIEFAVQQLNIFKTQNPENQELPTRILCLSDGGGRNSTNHTTSVVRLLIENNIKMDCVVLSRKVLDMHAIAKASGGFSFMPTSTEELLSIFEQETMLSMKVRQHCTAAFVPGQYNIDLNSQAILPADTAPRHIVHEKLNNTVHTVEKCLTRALIQKQLSSHTNTDLTKRILQELSYYQAHPHPAIEVFPGEEHIDFWRIIMEGPEGTPYEGGIFELFIEFTNEYPAKPPNIRFITPIYHCNINSSGRIYHPILDRFYTPGLRVGEILILVYELLINPQPDDYLDSVKANLFSSYKYRYTRNAEGCTRSYAMIRNREKVFTTLVGNEDNTMHAVYPEHLVCPLTMKLFEDPVTTLFGNIYERKAIEDHLKSGKNYDPLTFRELDKDKLCANNAIKKLAKDYM